LYTKKAKSFERWSEIHNMVLNRDHLSLKGLEKIKKLRKLINIDNSMMNKTGSKNP
jgi:hypothetical protein